jgi:DNA-binding transcriptional ArsR family regulator
MIHDPNVIADNLTGIRRDILEILDEPQSATSLAGRLGLSRQKINYHLRKLEDSGFVELAETRQRRGLTERLMRRTAEVVVVDPLAFSSLELDRQDVVGLSGVVASATDTIRRAAQVAHSAAASGSRIAASNMETEIRIADPQAMRRLLDDMAALMARYDNGTGLRVTVTSIILPSPPDA